MISPLEPRVVLSTILVTNTNDNGGGSLRAAIATANSTAGDDVIVFNFNATLGSQQPTPPRST